MCFFLRIETCSVYNHRFFSFETFQSNRTDLVLKLIPNGKDGWFRQDSARSRQKAFHDCIKADEKNDYKGFTEWSCSKSVSSCLQELDGRYGKACIVSSSAISWRCWTWSNWWRMAAISWIGIWCSWTWIRKISEVKCQDSISFNWDDSWCKESFTCLQIRGINFGCEYRQFTYRYFWW